MMQFIILGFVPGTELQLTFETVALFTAAFCFTMLCWLLYQDEVKLRKEIVEAVNKKAL